MILEVMGRDAGHIALNAGIAGGVDVILIPEIPYSLKAIANHIEKIRFENIYIINVLTYITALMITIYKKKMFHI